ncbi:unnamed protein product, partial [Gongylonema pulchrum]|uniref:Acyltransf_C domain-containing protein n=1 Tax=Gongylonema pulchrum TaxID=637853 RepID=A0A183D5K7_9BILA
KKSANILGDYIDCIYNVTIAYPVNIVQSEIDLILKGQAPRQVRFHIERIDIARVPNSDRDIANWINKLWIEKDEKLDAFYSQQLPRHHFPGDKDKFVWEEEKPLHVIVKLFIFCFWVSVIPIWLFHLTFLRFVQLGFVYFVAVYCYIYCKYGGIEQMVYMKWRHAMRAGTTD